MNVRIVRCMCNLRVGQRVPVRPEAQHARMDPCAVNENVFYTLRLDSRPPHTVKLKVAQGVYALPEASEHIKSLNLPGRVDRPARPPRVSPSLTRPPRPAAASAGR